MVTCGILVVVCYSSGERGRILLLLARGTLDTHSVWCSKFWLASEPLPLLLPRLLCHLKKKSSVLFFYNRFEKFRDLPHAMCFGDNTGLIAHLLIYT